MLNLVNITVAECQHVSTVTVALQSCQHGYRLVYPVLPINLKQKAFESKSSCTAQVHAHSTRLYATPRSAVTYLFCTIASLTFLVIKLLLKILDSLGSVTCSSSQFVCDLAAFLSVS